MLPGMKTTTSKTELTEGLAALRAMMVRGGKGSGYSPEARSAAIEYTRRARAAGATVTEVAKEIGVHPITLATWMKPSAPRDSTFVAVAMDARTPTRGLVLVSPTGWRLEGLDVAALRGLIVGEE